MRACRSLPAARCLLLTGNFHVADVNASDGSQNITVRDMSGDMGDTGDMRDTRDMRGTGNVSRDMRDIRMMSIDTLLTDEEVMSRPCLGRVAFDISALFRLYLA